MPTWISAVWPASRAAALLLLGLGLCPGAGAQTGPAANEVEVIVFRNLDQGGSTPEAPWPAGSGQDPVATAGGDGGRGAYPSLPPEGLRLAGAAERLRRAGKYQLLYHGGWVQPIVGQPLARGTPLPPEALRAGLAGSLTLYRERFLHVLVDVQLADPADAGHSWRIRQGRRLRGSTAHYFDHPRFGVIIAVRPVAAAEQAAP